MAAAGFSVHGAAPFQKTSRCHLRFSSLLSTSATSSQLPRAAFHGYFFYMLCLNGLVSGFVALIFQILELFLMGACMELVFSYSKVLILECCFMPTSSYCVLKVGIFSSLMDLFRLILRKSVILLIVELHR